MDTYPIHHHIAKPNRRLNILRNKKLVILVIAYVHITKIRSKVIIEIFRLSGEYAV